MKTVSVFCAFFEAPLLLGLETWLRLLSAAGLETDPLLMLPLFCEVCGWFEAFVVFFFLMEVLFFLASSSSLSLSCFLRLAHFFQW